MSYQEITNNIVACLEGTSYQIDEDNDFLYRIIDQTVKAYGLTQEQGADIYATIVEAESYAESVIERAVRRNV